MRDGSTEEYVVQRTLDDETGQCVLEQWFFNDELTCFSGPAYKEYDPYSGRLTRERWMMHGVEGRWWSDKPTETVWDATNGAIISETYRLGGKLHRDHHRPAKVLYSPETGSIIREEFWQNDVLHRSNGLPSIVEYDELTGKIVAQNTESPRPIGPNPTLSPKF